MIIIQTGDSPQHPSSEAGVVNALLTSYGSKDGACIVGITVGKTFEFDCVGSETVSELIVGTGKVELT